MILICMSGNTEFKIRHNTRILFINFVYLYLYTGNNDYKDIPNFTILEYDTLMYESLCNNFLNIKDIIEELLISKTTISCNLLKSILLCGISELKLNISNYKIIINNYVEISIDLGSEFKIVNAILDSWVKKNKLLIS